MTIYPIIFSVGPLQITGYGIMMMIGFLMGGWLIGQELKRRGWKEDYAGEIVVAAVIGGIIGAKLWYAILMQDAGALFSRGGMVWYGGFLLAPAIGFVLLRSGIDRRMKLQAAVASILVFAAKNLAGMKNDALAALAARSIAR